MLEEEKKQDMTFEEALEEAQKFVEKMTVISDREKEEEVRKLVSTENGARGFFVVYLTADNPAVEEVSTPIINALKSSPKIVSELLVKNLAMSAAMAITHVRNNDSAMAEKSKRVTQRCLNLIESLQLPEVTENVQEMLKSIREGEGKYVAFLERWEYDKEQKQAIAKAFTRA